MSVLRPGLLDGLAVAIHGADDALAAHLAELGAHSDPAGEDTRAVVYDARPDFAAGGRAGLTRAINAVWDAVGPHAQSLIERGRGGKVLLIAPPGGSAELASAVRPALENLARTLSVEWARYGITACAILPGADTTRDEIAELVAYLLSPAGDYFSGCALRLGG